MKKNKMMRLASVLLVLTLLSTSVISGTFAKYTNTTQANDVARVAKWDVKFNNSTLNAQTTTFSFDLFGTTHQNVKNGTAEEAIIAPGTEGSFDIVLKNDSEVTAEYTIDYTVTNTNNIPVEFCVDGTNWTSTLADVTTPVTLTMGAEATTITVKWRWVFEAVDPNTNADDTALGLNGTATITVDAKITATQVN